MIAKLICTAVTREECILKMQRALSEFIVEGIKTTVPFHLQLMQNEEFKAGSVTTQFMDTFEMKPI
jgi:acetyl-CoA carboxylase biotin carboxylase subunit